MMSKTWGPSGVSDWQPQPLGDAFINQLKAVCVVYPEVRVDPQEDGLQLMPSPTHIASKSGGLIT